MFDVAVAGSLHLDIVVKNSPLPAVDETVFGESWVQVCGGKGGNQAKAAAQFGARTCFIGRVGQDQFGETLRNDLVRYGIDDRHLVNDQTAGSGMSVAIIDRAGNYGASVVSGANLLIAESQLEDVAARVLLLQNEILQEINIAAARALRSVGAMVILNCAPWQTLSPVLAPLIDIFILNRVEKAQSGGMLDLLPKTQIVTQGAEGVVLQENGRKRIIAPHAVKQVNAHGAGDAFCGALAARLAAGHTLMDAARFANAAGALHVSGVRGERLTIAAVEALSGC